MAPSNIFDGDSYHAIFARLIYKRLQSRKWFTYADIMAEYMMLGIAKNLSCNVSNCDNYGELKKAFRYVRNAIKLKIGDGYFEEHGNNRAKKFRYIGSDDDPLADMRNAKVVKDLKKYWKFCQDSAGFFPTSWLEYFFKDCQDLLDIKSKKLKGELFLNASTDRMLTNIELLPVLYEAINRQQVLSIQYQPFEEESRQLVFHPHFLKEFNGRWYLFGRANGLFPENGYNVALDRIIGKPREVQGVAYMFAPRGFYEEFFKNIIGVSHFSEAKVVDIYIRAHSFYIFKLMETKALHHSQKTILAYDKYEDGEYGDFSVRVELNNEFIGRILQMGAGLEVVAPDEIRDIFKQRIESLAKLYE